MKKWWFIGGGNMAEAILSGALSKGILSPDDIGVSEVRGERRQELAGKYGVETSAGVGDAEAFLLAVKPQQAGEAVRAAAAAGGLGAGTLLTSICAGLPTAAIEGWCGARVVRVMPNLPATVGSGMAAVSGGARATPEDIASVKRLFAATGDVVEADEALLDLVTGISGSGPGYVFAFMEALEEAGVEGGFDRVAARKLAIATVRGAGELAALEAAKSGGADPAELRRRVSSKGGTTLAGLAAMEARGFSSAVRAAVAAATARAKELAGTAPAPSLPPSPLPKDSRRDG